MANEELPLEYHPFPPFIPENAKVLIMGTFPPGPHRWSMEFYYPNRTNDFWKVMGIIFYNDPEALYDKETASFKLDEIKKLLNDKGIALHDTGHAVRRLQGNASDKFLDIVEPVDLGALLDKMPDLRAVATTGEKAAGVIAEPPHQIINLCYYFCKLFHFLLPSLPKYIDNKQHKRTDIPTSPERVSSNTSCT